MTIRGRKGFSLIELLVAMGLSIFVMGTIIMLSTSTVRSQLDSARKGSATGATLYGLVRMQAELEDASYLSRPPDSTPTGDILSGCTNWSAVLGTRLDTSKNVTAFYYCVNNNRLLRYSNAPGSNTCNIPAPSCGSGNYETVVYSKPGFYRQSGWSYFVRNPDSSGIMLHAVVGNATPTQQNPNPSFFKFDTRMGMMKSYNNALD